MGIRFDYQVGAGMIGAYAAGQQEASRRKQKYGMAMLAQQQAHQNRMEELGTRYGGALGARRGAGQQGMAQQGVWTDPLQQIAPAGGGAFGNQQQVIHNRAARRARERKIRLGKPIPLQWQPTFESQDSIDLRQAQQQDAWKLADTQRGARVMSLRPIPDYLAVTEPELYNTLEGMRSDIRQMAMGGVLDFRNDPEGHAQKALDEKIAEYENLVETAPQADPNQGRLTTDPQTGLLRKIKQGSKEEPTHSWGGPGTEPQLLPEYVAKLKKQEADAEAAKQQQLDLKKQAAEAKQQREDYYRDRLSAYRNERDKTTGSVKHAIADAMTMAKEDTIAAFGEEVTEAPDPSVPSRGLLGVATPGSAPVVEYGEAGVSLDAISDAANTPAPDTGQPAAAPPDPAAEKQKRTEAGLQNWLKRFAVPQDSQNQEDADRRRWMVNQPSPDVLASEAVYYTEAGKQVLKGRSIPRPPAGQEGELKDGQLVRSTRRGIPSILRWDKKAGKYSLVAEIDVPESGQPSLRLL